VPLFVENGDKVEIDTRTRGAVCSPEPPPGGGSSVDDEAGPWPAFALPS
jgi:hypothetical protein